MFSFVRSDVRVRQPGVYALDGTNEITKSCSPEDPGKSNQFNQVELSSKTKNALGGG